MRILLIAAVLLASGCGPDEVTPPPGDGKIRPDPSGERIAEDAACSSLSNAFSKALLAKGCVGTGGTCPSLLRKQSGADCLQYDKGSLDGCIQHVNAQTECNAISAALDACIVFAYTDSAPTGCP